MKLSQLTIALVVLVFSTPLLHAQTPSVYDPTKDPRVYLRPYYDAFGIKADDDVEANCDETNFLRWLKRWYARMRPDGSVIDFPYNDLLFLNNNIAERTTGSTPVWRSLGPSSNSAKGIGIGMIHCVALHPTKTNIIYAGAAAGGFWMSTDTGAHWATTTDALASIGIDDIAVNPLDPNTIYAATGDRDFWNSLSIGVIKSTDGGYHWSATGLSFTQSDQVEMVKLIVDPNDTATIYAAQKTGYTGTVYKTTNAGATWSTVLYATEPITDIKMNPGNSSILYVGTSYGSFLYTTNAGATWTNNTSGVGYQGTPSEATIAVTPAAPHNVYILEEGIPGASDMNCGVYLSTNNGLSFTKMANNNIPTPVNWYGYVMDVSPTDPARLYVGGGYVFQSDDEGRTFRSVTVDAPGYPDYMHPDIHSARFRTNNEIFVTCDGGIYRSTDLSGPTWTWHDISGNMAVSQIYGFSSAANSASLFAMGMQDNGSGVVRADQVYVQCVGGDGMEPAINAIDSNIFYEASQSGDFVKTTDGGAHWTPFINQSSSQQNAAWTAPIVVYNKDVNTVWVGFQCVWKTKDQGRTWDTLGTFPPNWSGAGIQRMYVASDTNIIYVCFEWGSGFWRTVDNGRHWVQITYPTPASANYYETIDNFAVDSANPYHIWATALGYNAGQKVYESFDTGATWTNVSYNLPNVRVTAVAYENRSPFRVFVGTEMGVYYKQGHDTTWQAFGKGLPNTDVTQLEVHNLTNTLRAGTYGRGLWECSLATGFASSIANINNPGAGTTRISVYPNPSKGTVTIAAENIINTIAITNVQGQEVYAAHSGSNQVTTDISRFPAGIYFIKVNGALVERLVKE